MCELPEGLNFIPRLAEPSTWTPLGSRTRLNGSIKSSSLSLTKAAMVYYNGNYEGDTSMFGETQSLAKSQNTMDFIETDSDSEYKIELADIKSTIEDNDDEYEPVKTPHINQWQRLWDAYKYRFISEERLQQIATIAERVQENVYCRKFLDLLRFVYALIVWMLTSLLVSIVHFSNWSYGLWKSRLMLRSSARRLLWLMTVAKCGDIPLFALILCASPLLFAISFCGLIISLYCQIKDWIFHYRI